MLLLMLFYVVYCNDKCELLECLIGTFLFPAIAMLSLILCYPVLFCPVLSVLSVTLVYYSQTAGWFKMPLKVGLVPGYVVLDGDPAPPPQKKGAQPPIFGLCLLWANSWMDRDATWYTDRPRPRRHCVK